MPENGLPRKALQYRPQGKSDLGKTSLCSCRTGIDYSKLRMEEEEEEGTYACLSTCANYNYVIKLGV